MNRAPATLLAIEHDAFGLAVGTALVAGGLSLVAPFLSALVGALAALALASWTVTRAEERAAGVRRRLGRATVALALLGAGAALYGLAPEGFGGFRGIALALSLVPLWMVERRPEGRGRRSVEGR
jgi:hypothetical protein